MPLSLTTNIPPCTIPCFISMHWQTGYAVTSCIHYNTREGTFYQGRQSTLQRRKNGKREQQPCLEQCQLSLAQICLPSFQSTILRAVLSTRACYIQITDHLQTGPPCSCISHAMSSPAAQRLVAAAADPVHWLR